MLTPDEIAARQFLVSLRGYDRQEVQAFLREVADQQEALQRRLQHFERELEDARSRTGPSAAPAARSQSLEPTSPARDTRAAFAALGEETTRVLVAAEESAQAIRERAEERARAELSQARREARDEVESARRTASKIVADAERRRNAVAEEIRKLEGTRDDFLGALRDAVKGVQSSVRGMQPSERGAGGGEDAALGAGSAAAVAAVGSGPAPVAEPEPAVPEPVAQSATAPEPEPGPTPEPDPAAVVEPADEPAPASDAPPAEDAGEPAAAEPATSEPDGIAGEDLETITRSFGSEAVADADEDGVTTESSHVDPDRTTEDALTDDAQATDALTSAVAQAALTDEVADAEEVTPPAEEPVDEPDAEAAEGADLAGELDPIALRDDSLAGVRPGMARRLKRGLQDVQNGVLDAIRQAGDAPNLPDLLPSDEELSTLGEVGQLFLTAAYRAGLVDGATLAGVPAEEVPEGDESQVPASAATFRAVVAHEIAASLTATLRAGIEAQEPETSLSERVGEVFRDLKGPVVEGVVDEHLARVYGYGLENAFERHGVGAKSWVVGEEPRCPANQCRVNAEDGPVGLGSEFPSGERVPPAHDGCTCALKPA